MRLYRTPCGRWAGTLKDAANVAREAASTFTEIEVPTDKPGLLHFLDAHRVGPITADPAPMPKFLQALERDETPASDLADAIRQTSGTAFAQALEAVLHRAGELDEAGWRAFARLFGKPGVAIERGLRFVALAQLRQMEGPAK